MIDEGLKPLMGYMLWQMQHYDMTADQARQAAEGNQNYQGFTEAEYNAAMYEASANFVTTEFGQKLGGERQIGEAVFSQRNAPGVGAPVAVSGEECVGVRVLIVHIDPAGNESNLSVVLNVPAKTSIDEIDRLARNYFESGELSARTGHASPGTLGASGIFQVVQGGLPGASVRLCE